MPETPSTDPMVGASHAVAPATVFSTEAGMSLLAEWGSLDPGLSQSPPHGLQGIETLCRTGCAIALALQLSLSCEAATMPLGILPGPEIEVALCRPDRERVNGSSDGCSRAVHANDVEHSTGTPSSAWP